MLADIRPAASDQGGKIFASEALVGDELAKPTHPSTREDTTVRNGQEAWCRLRANSTWGDWVAVGAAHVIGRGTAMRDAHSNTPKGRGYNAAFIAWQKKFGFETLDKGDRARLFEVMSHLKEIDDWLQKLPESERLRLKAATVEPKTSEQRISPVQKLKDSVAARQGENDRMKREIERGGGDLWDAKDRPQDIARVIVDKVGRGKADQIAQEIIKAVKTYKSTMTIPFPLGKPKLTKGAYARRSS